MTQRKRLLHRWVIPIVLAGVCLVRLTGAAQVPVSAIRGTVTDATGAPIPGATVTLKDNQTGLLRTTLSQGDGQYQVEGLAPGNYAIAITAPSFATSLRTQTLQVGDDRTLNVALRPGQTEQVIEVRGEASSLNLTDSQIGGIIARVQVNNLPLNGRNFLELARLEPGVSVASVANPGGGGNTYLRVSLPGARFSQTRISVDGAATNERLLGGILINFSQETVQEFQIATFSLDPSTSTTGAGAINIASRRGGNDVHGSAFFFFRDHNLAAYPGLRRNLKNSDPFFARRQSGFSIGGPFKRRRLFWFGNYEHDNQDGVFDVVNNHPIFDKLNVIYPSPLNFNLFNFRTDAAINAKNTAFLRLSLDRNNNIAPPAAGIFMPSNWQVSSSAGTQIAGGITSVLGRDLINDARLSYVRLNGSLQPMTANQCQDSMSCLGVGGAEIHIFDAPSFVIGNQVNVPFLRSPRTYQLSDNLTWQDGAHQLRFGGEWEHLILVASVDVADPAVITLWGPTNVQQIPSLYNALPQSLRDPSASPPTLTEILQLPLRGFTMGIGNPALPGSFNFDKASHDDELRFYFQDAWKLRHALTLSYGLAYSYDTHLFNDDLQRPAYLTSLLGGNLRAPHPQTLNFDPSVGLVWGVGKNQKTVIRAGSGIYHDEANFYTTLQERRTLGPSGDGRVAVDGSVAGLSFLSTPTSYTGANLVSLLPTIRSNLTAKLGDGTDPTVRQIEVLKQGQFIFDPNQTIPYAIQINAGVQTGLGANWVLSGDYVMRRYAHGGGIQFSQPPNQTDQNRFNRPRVTGINPDTGVVSFVRDPVIPLCTSAQAAALDPSDQCSTGPITFMDSALYRYQALQVRLDKRLSSHFQMQIGYALARNIGLVALSSYADHSQNYGNVGNGVTGDIRPTPRQTVVASGVFDPPRYRGSSGLLRGLLNHWTLAAISEVDSAPALDTMLTGLDLDGDGLSNTLLPGTTRHNTLGEGLSVTGLRTLVAQYNAIVDAHTKFVSNPNGTVTAIRPRTPFNQVINPIALPAHFSSGDSFISQDVRLTRQVMIGERVKLALLGEVFNLFNIANLTGYSNILSVANYGQPSARAGQVFGSGGPRAFQFGTRVEF